MPGKQTPGQSQLPDLPPRSHYHDDYRGVLPPRVLPLNMEVLEQGDSLLFVKRYGHKQEITPKQRQIFKLLVRLGEGERAGGDVTVLCLWGGPGVTARAAAKFDYTGEKGPAPVTDAQVRRLIDDWWRTHGRRR